MNSDEIKQLIQKKLSNANVVIDEGQLKTTGGSTIVPDDLRRWQHLCNIKDGTKVVMAPSDELLGLLLKGVEMQEKLNITSGVGVILSMAIMKMIEAKDDPEKVKEIGEKAIAESVQKFDGSLNDPPVLTDTGPWGCYYPPNLWGGDHHFPFIFKDKQLAERQADILNETEKTKGWVVRDAPNKEDGTWEHVASGRTITHADALKNIRKEVYNVS